MPSFERRLYGFPPLTKTRDPSKPLKLLCLGYSRSGTESLRTALESLSLKTYHGYDVVNPGAYAAEAFTYLGRRKFGNLGGIADLSHEVFGGGAYRNGDVKIGAQEFDFIIGDCQAVTEAPLVCFAAELIAAYPDAKVLLNSRDVDEWYKSYGAAFGKWDDGIEGWRAWGRSWFIAELYWLERTKTYVQRKYFYGDFERTGKWVYRQHCDAIRGLLRDQPERLMEWKVEDGWEGLCGFLQVEVPKGDGGKVKEFPKGNESAEFAGNVQEKLQTWNEKADQRGALFMAFVSMFFGILAAMWVFRYLDSLGK